MQPVSDYLPANSDSFDYLCLARIHITLGDVLSRQRGPTAKNNR
jgi:hypothetical protein